MKIKFTAKLQSLFRREIPEQQYRGRFSGVMKRHATLIEHWIADKGWAEDASLGEIASSLGIDKEDFSLYFRRKFLKSFLRWRKEVRITEAKHLLVKFINTPTALIGEAVGIYDKSNFKRQFRELTGYTPAQWRLKQQIHIRTH